MLLQRFVRSFVIEACAPAIKALLLRRQMHGRWLCGLGLERLVHTLVAAVLFRMTRRDAFVTNAESDPPRGEARDRQPTVRKRIAVVGPDGLRQTMFAERLFEPWADQIPG